VIPENLSKKNIILIDESVASGGTIRKSIDYLFDEKGVSSIYATCIYTNKEMNYRNVQLHPQGQTNHICFIWPWGYDN
jgi:uracil phosphoribosyltransferase